MADITIADVRAKYPQYHDMSDDQLAQGLHQKFYADMPYEQFSAKIGLGPKMTQPVISTEGMPPAEVHPQTTMGKVSDYVRDTAGNAIGLNRAHELAGAVLAPISGLAGIAGAALPGPPGQGANWVQGVQNLARYVPGTRPNEQVQNFQEQVPGAVQATGEAAGLSPANAGAILPAAQAASVAIPGGMGLRAGRVAANEAASTAASERAAAPVHPTVRALNAGFEGSPSEIRSQTGATNVPGNLSEAVETPQQSAGRNVRNVTKATNMAADEIGAPKTDVITPEHIEEAKQAPGAAYTRTGDAVGTVGGEGNPTVKPETIDALEGAIGEDKQADMANGPTKKDMRRMITGLQSGKYQGGQVIRDISSLRDEGSAASMRAADALEGELENQLQGKPQALKDFTDARQQFAKIYDVDAITQKFGGRVNFGAAKSLEHTKGRPLTGGLAEISNAASALPESTRPPASVAASAEVPTTAYQAAKGVAKAVARKVLPDVGSAKVQAGLSAAVPTPGRLPVGPPQAGIPNVRQLEVPGGAPGGTLEPPPGPVPPRSPVRGPLGNQLALQGPNADLAPPEGVTPAHRYKGPTGPQAEAELHAPILERPPGNAPGGFSVRGPAGPQLENQGPNADMTPPPGSVGGRTGLRPPPVSLEPPPGSAGAPPSAAPNQLGLALSQPAEVPLKPVEAPPPSPKAKPEGGSPATEALFEEEVKRDADRAHAANAANGGKTKGELNAPKLGDDLANMSTELPEASDRMVDAGRGLMRKVLAARERNQAGMAAAKGPAAEALAKVQARTAKPRSATKAWGSGPVGSKDAMEAMDRLQEGEPIESIVKDMTSRGYPQETVDADLRDIKASTERGPAPAAEAGLKKNLGLGEQLAYHGTGVQEKNGLGNNIEQFDRLAASKALNRTPGMDAVGTWFSDRPEGANLFAGGRGGAVYPTAIKLKNPWRPKDFNEFLDRGNKAAGRAIDKSGAPTDKGPRGRFDPEPLRKELKAAGYDGIEFPEGNYDGVNQKMHVIFEPEQARSALERGPAPRGPNGE